MWRRLRWVLLALVVVVAGLAAAAVLTQKPTLDDDAQAVDARWTTLRAALVPRYAALEQATTVLGANGQGQRAVTKDLVADLATWKQATGSGSVAAQTQAANRLEGQGARLRANILGSPLLSQNQSVVAALAAFDGVVPPTAVAQAYDRAVQTYEDDRTSVLRAPVATVFGFDARPRFDLRT